MSAAEEVRHEQSRLDIFYARLDHMREHTEAELAQIHRAGASGTPQNRSERDAFAALHEQRFAQLRGVEDRLCFGRLDLAGGQRRYVGRIGLSDDRHAQLLVDWRAPAARPFYEATAAAPGDVVRRRHLVTRARTVVGVEDEVLDLAAIAPDDRPTLNGEGALLAAVGAHRTGRMGDIIATIQAEQDRVIRSEPDGVLVVQGGPGTGKTAVALHRAAYLLYTHRERLARGGVLVVGPNEVFLRYIEQVLPSLGETGVVMSTPAQLFPGVVASAAEPARVAALKGDPRMARVIAAAVRDRQRVPEGIRHLDVDGVAVELRPDVVAAARARARASRQPHNLARRIFVRELLADLAGRLARTNGVALTEDNRAELVADLRDSRDVRREVNLSWMPLTPGQLLADLYADPARLASAAPSLTAEERTLLRRGRDASWTVADVPLLDEAAQLLGEDDTAARLAARRAAEQRQAEVEYARGVLALTGGGGMVSAETLADRFTAEGPRLTVAERAERDRSWAYGHVVVDEAQELSPMMWRLLMRRCPRRSMTVVGDLAQTGSPAGAHAWGEVLDRYVAGRWRLAELTVNYRTPAQVMTLATAVLRAAGIRTATPTSVREGDRPPTTHRIAAGDLAAVVAHVEEELDLLGEGRLAVITARAEHDAVRRALTEALPEGTVAAGVDALDAPVAVLSVAEAKGLEFDAVVLHEPGAVLTESSRGANDLYVALTRPTQRLRVLHSADLPPGLDGSSAVPTPTEPALPRPVSAGSAAVARASADGHSPI